MAAAPELIPEGVTIAEALPTVGMLAAFLFVLGLIYVVDGFVRAFFGSITGTVGKLPIIGKWIDAPIHKLEQKATETLGSAESYFDAHIGVAFHKLARIGDQLGRELYGLAVLGLTIAKIATGQATTKDLARVWHALVQRWRAAEHAAEHAFHRAVVTEHVVTKTVGANVLPRIRVIEHELDHVFTPELRVLRERTKALEREAAHTFQWIRAHPRAVVSTAFVGAVAWALARLGGGWIRCNNWKRIGRHVCGLPARLIEDLLAGVIDVLVIADLCRLTRIMVSLAESRPVQEALNGIIVGIDDLILCQGVNRPPALEGYWTAPPTGTAFAALPG